MKAILKTGNENGQIEVRDVPEPSPKENEVKIKIAYAGICGTDLGVYSGAKQVNPPIIMGHEFSGVITEVGAGVKGWKAGDRVIAETTKEYCGQCVFCKTGRHSLCAKRGAFGQQVDGVYADYVCQKQEFLHRIPENVSLKEAALVEPAACTCHAIFDRNSFKANDKVLVIGPGPMGLLTVEMLKTVNAFVVITGVSVDKERLELAKTLGADAAAVTPEVSIQELVDSFTNGEGFDYVLDCAGSENCIESAFEAVKKCGTILQIGTPGAKGVFLKHYADIMMRELTVKGAFSHRYTNWDKTLDLVGAELLDLKKLISHTFTLEQAKEAFETKGKIKVLFEIHPELGD